MFSLLLFFRKEREKGNSEGDNGEAQACDHKMRRKDSAIANKKEKDNRGTESLKENEKERQEKIPKGKPQQSQDSVSGDKDKMTVIFHAVLAPHFNFEENKGDRIFMRFGGVQFGNFNRDIVELKPERYNC